MSKDRALKKTQLSETPSLEVSQTGKTDPYHKREAKKLAPHSDFIMKGHTANLFL